MTTVEQTTNYLKGTCYTKSGDKTSFEQDQWHGFSEDGYSSSVYVPLKNRIRYSSWHTDSTGNIVHIDDGEYLTFDHNVGQTYHEIIEEPSSSSYEYKVAVSTVGYDELCEKVAEYAENNVERLSGYTMDKLTTNISETGDDFCTFYFSFNEDNFFDAKTWYGDYSSFFYSYNVICSESYYTKKD